MQLQLIPEVMGNRDIIRKNTQRGGKYCNPNKINTFVMLITFLCLLLNFHIQNIPVRAVNLPTHRNVISTQPERVFCIMPSRYKLICQKCGTSFISGFKTAKYCTQECYFNTKKRSFYTKCKSCDNIFLCKYKNNIYCSIECRDKGKSEIRNCLFCGDEFKVPIGIINRGKDAGKFCSRKCVNSYKVKNKNSNWRGGINYDSALKQKELLKLRPIIRNKYNYTCQKCGINGDGIILDVHHIVPYRLTRDNSLSNLTLLCHSCHMKESKNEIKLFR